MSQKEFFSAFLKQGKNIGAVAPSSKFLVKKMVAPIDFNGVKCIVEFGPGTGIITHELLNKMPADAVLLAFEINEDFCIKLNTIHDPRLKIISDSAENLESYLQEHKIDKVDYIVSSLPFAMIPNGIIRNILKVSLKVMKPTGAYIQYQYSLLSYRQLKNVFKKIDMDFTAMNIPPAFVFTCTN